METKKILCIDEVDETQAMLKCTEKATWAMEKINADCNLNLTAGPLEAVLEVVVDTCVMLCRNISTSSGPVNEAVSTVIVIKTHHITVQFDGRAKP